MVLKRKLIFLACLLVPISWTSYSQINSIDSLKHLCSNIKEDSSRIQNLTELSKAYIPSNFDSSGYYLDSAYNMAKRLKYRKEEIECLNLYGVLAWYKNDLPAAKKYFEECYQYSKTTGPKRTLAKVSGNVGLICNTFGDYIEGQPYLEEAIELFRQLKDTDAVSKNQVDLSHNFSERGLYKEATEHLLEAIHFFEKHNSKNQLIYAYFGLGDLYYKMNSSDPALHYFEESIRMDDRESPTNHISSSLVGIGLVYENLKNDLEKAENYYHQALEVTNDYNSENTIISVTNNLAGIYYKKKEYVKALEQYKKAYKLFEGSNYYNSELPIILNIGKLYFHLGQYDSARAYLNEGLEKAELKPSPEHVEIAQLHLFKLDSTLGDYPSAIEHLNKARGVHDDIWKQENIDKIKELEIRFETEKKEQENLQLKKENELKANIIHNHRTIGIIIIIALMVLIVLGVWLGISRKKLKVLNQKLEAQKKDLQQLNLTKDKFFSIIAHDLKSPFSSLLGLLNLLEEDFDTMDDEEKMEIITSLQKSSHNTYNLLMNLLEWSLNQKGQINYQPVKIRLADSVENVFKVLANRAKLKNHRLEAEIPNDIMLVTDKMMLETVVLNLVNNSIKFTRNGGRITVSASHKNGSVCITVKDNGVGIPSEELARLFDLDSEFKRPGTNSEMGTGLGLILCNDFIHLFGGTFTVESKENQGSTFSFTIPDHSAAHSKLKAAK